MLKVQVYNAAGEATGSIELPGAVFAVKPKPAVIHQVYVAQMANSREPWGHTKQRGEVRGGGKKPWKQKGTGRARHGSIRSPIWRGGGVVFGPRNTRQYAQKVNQKMKQLAVRMCLSDKVTNNVLVVVESFPTDGKTKVIAALRRALPGVGKSVLMLPAVATPEILRATRNLPRVAVERASDVSVADLLHHQYLLTTRDGIETLVKRLA